MSSFGDVAKKNFWPGAARFSRKSFRTRARPRECPGREKERAGGHARRGDHAVVLRADGDFLPLGAGRRARDLPRGHLQEGVQQPTLLGRLALRDCGSSGWLRGQRGRARGARVDGSARTARAAARRASRARGRGRTASFLTGPDMATDARHGLTPGRETNVFLWETSLIISRQRCPVALVRFCLVRLHENNDACCVKNLSRPVRQFVAQRTDCDTSRPSQPPQRLVHQRLVLPRVDGLRPGRGRRGRGSPHVPNRATMNAVRFLVFARAAARLRR
jgi:hypothetical protein